MSATTRRKRLLSPRAAEIGRKIRQEEWYQTLSTAPHHGARAFAAALLLGAIDDELREELQRDKDTARPPGQALPDEARA